MNKKVKIITTLGPATKTEADLRKIKDKGVDFVRINMSHSDIADLKYFIDLARKVDIPFIIDTEGSQIRTGDHVNGQIVIEENDEIKIYDNNDKNHVSLRPAGIIEQLDEGDLIHIDMDALILRVSDVTTAKEGYITVKAITSGTLGENKAVVIDPCMEKKFILPPLSPKDYQSIELGLKEGIEFIAASFMRSGEFVDEVRRATKGSMKIISKMECVDGLNNLEEIIAKSDYLLIDRGDLSKEIPLEKIPFTQKVIMSKAREQGKKVFVATNLLESMVTNRKPTRAEIHDVIATLLDGAYGLVLSSETAIGKYPFAVINMINKLIKQSELISNQESYTEAGNQLAAHLQNNNYIFDIEKSSNLITPHGGKLINRILKQIPDQSYINCLEKVSLNENLQMDVEQIAMGTFSPIEGFMGREDLQGVLDKMRLTNGVAWTIPIILDISSEQAARISIGDTIALCDEMGVMALMHIDDKYFLNKDETALKLYNTSSKNHPGVRWIHALNPVLIGGKIDLIRRRKSEFKQYELTPKQVRRMFEERGWSKVVGFHTRNVIHKSHEFIQLQAMDKSHADGLFVHPVIGKKKPGDYHADYIIQSYEHMVKDIYPKDKVILATFSTFSRYAGPREAVFTALCRKNYGCSHFIVGRDHTGVGDFYHPHASHKIFDEFDDLDIVPVKFDKVFYSKKHENHIHEPEMPDIREEDKLHISGTQAREMLEKGETPPDWFMHPAISEIIISALKQGQEVFVPKKELNGQVLWLTGLSGSGKTTLALRLKEELERNDKKVTIIDGDDIRDDKHKHLGFTREDIRQNNRLIAELVNSKINDFDYILVPVISPYTEDRLVNRQIIGNNFKEVYINSTLESCINRDVKGLYQKAKDGQINDMIGYSESNPYEAPLNPDIEIKTDELDIEQSLKRIMEKIN